MSNREGYSRGPNNNSDKPFDCYNCGKEGHIARNCPSSTRANDNKNKIYVGNLSFDTTDRSLKEAFVKYGEVTVGRVMVDHETGRSKGFGFVTFASPSSVEKALDEAHGTEIDGREVRVNPAQDRPGGGAGGYYSGGGGGRGGYGRGSGGGGGYSGRGDTYRQDYDSSYGMRRDIPSYDRGSRDYDSRGGYGGSYGGGSRDYDSRGGYGGYSEARDPYPADRGGYGGSGYGDARSSGYGYAGAGSYRDSRDGYGADHGYSSRSDRRDSLRPY